MNCEQVAEWVEHAVLLPMHAAVFRENAIMGYDFPGLLEAEGELLLKGVL